MTKKSDLHARLDMLIAQGRINDALEVLDNEVTASPSLRPVAAEVERLRQCYGYMSSYALRSLPDPGLPEAYTTLTDDLRSVADTMHRIELTAEAPTLYFNTLRYEQTQLGVSIRSLLDEYRRLHEKLSLVVLAENVDHARRDLTQRLEGLEKRIFNRVWVTFPLSTDDVATLSETFASKSAPDYFKQLLIGAVGLGLTEYYDEKRLLLLMDCVESASTEAAIAALTGLLTGMWIHRSRHMSRRVSQRLDALAETPGWERRVRMVTMQFVRARDTERITRKFNDELLPEMMKLRPDIEKISNAAPFNPEQLEENPEWADMLDKSGVTDRLKELQELQEDGGDVMMATFGKLKTFPFFNDISNWFLPFHPDHSLLVASDSPELMPLAEMMGAAPMFCDNDKFSILLSLSNIPASQREMMASQMRMQSEQMEQMRMASLNHRERAEEEAAANCVHNLYRFHKLFRRKGEFSDPFASDMNLPALPALAKVFDDPDTLMLIGEFYFKRGYYADAYQIFSTLSERIGPSAELFQKMGYCRQATGYIPAAIKLYEQAELLNASSPWTMRRLAACYRTINNWPKAADYYMRLADDNADDANFPLNAGIALVHLHRYDEALAYLYKAEFLGNSSKKTIHAIAWCSMHCGDYPRARKYTEMLLASKPSANDLLNAGHLELLTGHFEKAVGLYADSIAARNFDTSGFMIDFESDSAEIEAFATISPLHRAIVLDHALTRARSFGTPIE